jgi:hypothetical protein
VGSQLEALVRSRGDLRLRKVDVVSWVSPVARQYDVRQLPWLWLYRDGERIATGSREVLERLAAGN